MDPTERLYCLILISREVKNIDKLIIDIEDAIKDGAVLDNEYYSYILNKNYNIPILFAIQLQVSIKIIECLKKYWWKERNDFNCVHMCDECDVNGLKDGWLIAKGSIQLYLNNESEREFIYGYFAKLFDLFNVEYIEDEDLRHKFINKYIIR